MRLRSCILFMIFVSFGEFLSIQGDWYRSEGFHATDEFRLVNGVFNDAQRLSYTVASKIECSVRCLSLGPGRCTSVNYNKENRTCEINDKTIHDDAGTVPTAYDGWEFYNTARGPPNAPSIISVSTTQPTARQITWVAGDDGEFDQTFTLAIKSQGADDSTYVTILSMADPGHRGIVTSHVTGLSMGNTYTLKLTSTNTRPVGINSASVTVDITASLPSSCTEWKQFNTTSGLYWVDPDGGGGMAAFEVYCDMSSTPPMAYFHHDQEVRTRVDGFENAMSYSVSLTYTVSISNVVAYVDNVGVSCSQYLKYECRDSTLRQYGGWYDRDGNIATFWAGGTPGGASYNCACSRDGSCADPSDHCNCDANDNVWRSDEGYITQSSYLPITIVKFGDTGDSDEEGYHTVGPLVCQG